MTSFQAVQCTKLEKSFKDAVDNLKISSVQRKPLKKGEVRIKVYAASLNYFDLLMLVGRYQHSPPLPFTPGSEISGQIVEKDSSVSNWNVGDEVIVGMSVGGMATEMIAPAHMCIPKPKELSHPEASALFVGFMTAFHGLVHRGNLQKDEYLLVTGAGGGMGLAAVQLGKILGAKVIAAASSDEKLKAAKEMGADATINYATESLKDRIASITNNRFVDVCYEVVGGSIFDQCVRCMGDQGRLLVVGFASGTIPSVPANLPLVKGFSIVGVRAGESMRRHPHLALEMFQQFQEWTSQGKLVPHIKIFTKEQFKDAFHEIADRKALGKCVVVWNDDSIARL